MKFKPGERVKTPYGSGTVVKQYGVLSHRYIVTLDNPPALFKAMNRRSGLGYMDKELEKIK